MCLRLLHQLNHPNIIPLLGSYTYQGEHNLLFPCIAMDLKQCLKGERFAMFDWDFTFFSALWGLGSALSKLHQLYLNKTDHKLQLEAIGYHHDIRPANILVSLDTFILADFGMGNYKPAAAISQTPWKSTIGDYLAPECMDESHKPHDVGRAIDVWAFGCLLAEVVTYMLKGATGVDNFRRRRDLPGRMSGWSDCGFYRPDGKIKDEAKDWLHFLAKKVAHGDPCYSILVELSLQALTGDPKERPKINHICLGLSVASLKAHFQAVEKRFARHLAGDFDTPGVDRRYADNLWLFQERLRAWGHALLLHRSEIGPGLSSTIEELHDVSIADLVALFQQLNTRSPHSPGNLSDEKQSSFEGALDQLIERLWDHLPTSLRRRAENCWHQAILETKDMAVFESVHRQLRTRYTVYDITNALAMMKKISLEMLQPDSLEASAKGWSISLDDLDIPSSENGRQIGYYKGTTPVLIEKSKDKPRWTKIDPVQQRLVTSLKAKGFGFELKSNGLIILKCIGAIVDSGDKDVYGLIYEIPIGMKPTPRTLLQYLELGEATPKSQPALGDKFRFALALADFLQQFHTIGWVHENFNPHNVLFFTSTQNEQDADRGLSSNMKQGPYVVGLHKSRPHGEFWQTEGPYPDDNYHDYQHPEYSGSGRYLPCYDYYSLGIILLEIGLWRPLKNLISSKRFTTMGGTELRTELMNMAQNELGPRMGAKYRDTVLRCMNGSLKIGFDSSLDETNAGDRSMLESFGENVVEPLERLATAPI